MKIWAVSLVLDEADILPTTINHLWDQGVDGILVADNGSSDGTPDIAAEFGAGVILTPGGFYQMNRLTNLAHQVGEQYGADWVIPFDADEIWCAQEGTLRDALIGGAISAPFYNHYPTGADPLVGEPFDRMPWKWSGPHGTKMAARYHPRIKIGLGSHRIVTDGRIVSRGVFIHHFPWRSLEQYRKKVARADRMSSSLLKGLRDMGDRGFEGFYFEDPLGCRSDNSRQGWPPGELVFDPWRS